MALAVIPELLELYCGTKCLCNATPLATLGFGPEALIHVRFTGRIKFQQERGEPFELPFRGNSTVKDAKLALVPRLKCKFDSIVLGFGGKTFGDHELLHNLRIPLGRSILVKVQEHPMDRNYFFMMQHEAFQLDLGSEATAGDALEVLTPRASKGTKSISLFYDGIPLGRRAKLTELKMDGCIVAETVVERARKLKESEEPFVLNDEESDRAKKRNTKGKKGHGKKSLKIHVSDADLNSSSDYETRKEMEDSQAVPKVKSIVCREVSEGEV
jgi:hypothetical protein